MGLQSGGVLSAKRFPPLADGRVRIRAGIGTDANAVARLHVHAWQDSYRGIMPDDVLDNLDMDQRKRMWTGLMENPGQMYFYVAEVLPRPEEAATRKPVVAGVISGGPPRQYGQAFPTTIYALYVEPKVHRRGLGKRLLLRGFQHVLDDGHNAVALAVLEDNTEAIRFYEAMGGERVGYTYGVLANTAVRTALYGWSDVKSVMGLHQLVVESS